MKSFILYGLGGADTQYVALRYYIIDGEDFTMSYAKMAAGFMRMDNPTIQTVYLVDNRRGLRREYLNSVKDHHNSIEARYAFRDTLEREGVRII